MTTNTKSLEQENKPITGFIITQFLGAINDNAFRMFLIGIATSMASVADPGQFKSLVLASFTLPFLLFSVWAGTLADRFSKQKILLFFKAMEIAVMLFAWVAFTIQSQFSILLAVFLMGAQSAFFSPAKYGIIPEISHPSFLSKRNGLLELTTFVGIVAGQTLGGLLRPHFGQEPAGACFIFVGLAVLGTLAAKAIPHVPASGGAPAFRINFVSDLWCSFRKIREIPGLWLTAVGIAYFWFLGAFVQVLISDYGEHLELLNQGTSHQHLIYPALLVALSLGIGLGSFVAGHLSHNNIEFGLIPIGSLGMGGCGLALAYFSESFLGSAGSLFFLGFGGGFFIIPLTTYLQASPPPEERGRLIAASNFLTFIGVMLASVAYFLLREVLELSPRTATFWIAGLTVLITGYITCLLPHALIRFVIWVLTHTFYKLKIKGSENIPREGPGLIVCNHISYADHAFLIACTSRFIRFLMFEEFLHFPVFGPLAKAMKVIPISGTASPKAIIRALQGARRALQEGELVCIFPEGQVSRTGNMLRFREGIEYILKGQDVPVIPVHLDRVWGSIFSFERRRFFQKIPYRIPYPVTVYIGEAHPSTVKAYQLREVVQELGSRAFQERKSSWVPLPMAFVRRAKKSWRRSMMADSLGQKFTFGEALIGSWLLAKRVRSLPLEEKNMGILIPPCCPGVLINMAVMLAGRTPVNLNYTASPESLQLAVTQSKIHTIITTRTFLEKIKMEIPGKTVFLEDWKPGISKKEKFQAWLMLRCLPYRWIVRLAMGDQLPQMDDLATLIFSSGSTGTPKGVMLSHANIYANVEGLSQVMDTNQDDCVMGILPFFHSFGYTGTMWLPVLKGFQSVYHPNPMDTKKIGQMVQEQRATIIVATPTFLLGYIRRCTKEQFQSLRLVITGAEKLRARVAASFKEKFDLEPKEGYGCTECAPIVSLNVPCFDDQGYAGESIKQVGTKAGTIGHPLPGVSIRIVDPTTGETKKMGETGLMLVKGTNVMQGYLGQEELTREVLKEGWYQTGDLARVDEDGFIEILDRLSRFSKIGGEMIPHLRIEEALHQVLNTEEMVCAVTGVPDEKKGERLAVVHTEFSLSVAELVQNMSKSGLPNLWIPKVDSFIQVDSIPLLGTGKLDLKSIKQIALDQLKVDIS